MANPNGPWPTVTKWKPEILAAAKKYGVNPSILAAVVQHESGGREGLTSSAGAKGLTQFMPGTAASYGVNVAPGHALSQIEGTAHYLKDLGVNKDPLRALAAYGAGPGNIPGGMGYARADLAISKNYRGLDGQTLAAPVTPGASGTRTRTTTQTVPGTDNSAARRDLIAQFVMQGGPSNDNALIGLASALPGLKDTAPRKITKTTPVSVAPGAGSTSSFGPGSVRGFKPGSPVPGVAPHGATHQTDGLPGYPAFDYMAPAGAPALAPVSGTVFKLSGHDPAAGPTNGPHGPFGWSVYIRGDDGRLYFLTHMGSRNVRVGQRVQAGRTIGTVGNYAKWGGANHIHMGVHG